MNRQKKRALEIRTYLNEQKIGPDGLSIPCLDCDLRFKCFQMHFDHVRGEKVENLSVAARKRWSIERIDEEIRKCDLVCVGCHRIRTHGRFDLEMDPVSWERTGFLHTCIRCKKEYDRGFFHFSNDRICWCLPCEYLRRSDRREARRAFVDSVKTSPCSSYGSIFRPLLMDFDHIDPSEKSFSISHGVRMNVSLERLVQEIKKCRLMCVWCHTIVTHEANGTA